MWGVLEEKLWSRGFQRESPWGVLKEAPEGLWENGSLFFLSFFHFWWSFLFFFKEGTKKKNRACLGQGRRRYLPMNLVNLNEILGWGCRTVDDFYFIFTLKESSKKKFRAVLSSRVICGKCRYVCSQRSLKGENKWFIVCNLSYKTSKLLCFECRSATESGPLGNTTLYQKVTYLEFGLCLASFWLRLACPLHTCWPNLRRCLKFSNHSYLLNDIENNRSSKHLYTDTST